MVAEALADVYLLSHAAVFVGSLSSTFGAFASRVAHARRGYRHTAYIDGDDNPPTGSIFHFPRQSGRSL